jgi:hypothetical protein
VPPGRHLVHPLPPNGQEPTQRVTLTITTGVGGRGPSTRPRPWARSTVCASLVNGVGCLTRPRPWTPRGRRTCAA